MFLLRPISLAALALCSQQSVFAQTSSTESEAALQTVTVEASADASAQGLPKSFAGGQVARGARVGVLGNQDMMETPFSATSYTSDLIQDQQAKSVGDVLLNDAGVRPARGFGNFQQAYFVRGFVLYSDDVAYNGLYGLVPRQYMASEFVERVEVFRGANAFLSGAGAGSVSGGGLGGLINVVPKRAGNEPLNRVTLGGASGGQAYAAADVARRFGPDDAAGVRLNLARHSGGTGVSSEKVHTTVGSLGLDWRSSRTRLSADLGWQEHKLTAPRPSLTPSGNLPIPAAPDSKTNYAQPWTYSNSRDLFGTVRGEYDFNDQWTGWAAVGMRRGSEDNALSGLTLSSAAGDATVNRFDNTRKNRVKTGELGLRGKFETGSVKHSVVASLSAFDSSERNAWGYNYATGQSNNIYNPVALPAPGYTGLGGILGSPRETERIKTSSLALADTLGFMDERLLLTVGMRYQSIKVDGFDATTGASSGNYDKSRVTPVAGLVFKLTPEVSAYANYIEGLAKGGSAPMTNGGQVVSNAGQVFAPYVSRQKEAGLKYDGGNIGASASFFTTSMPSAYVQNNVYGVFGKQRNRGLEFNVFGEPVKGLRLLGGLTLLDAKYLTTASGANDGKRVVGVPRSQANIGADWDVPGVHGLALNARLMYTGAQYANAGNTQRVPAWTRFDLGARYLMDVGGKLVTLNARVDNVANRNYWASVGGYATNGYLVQGAPRTFSLTASVDF
ncbi:TonB-dependent receptor [Comamonas thiooxydans]|uniref:TonB-dependent receptor n=1 Tax=Comamonas thiooxydans TaxID=363952 RepID=UPI001CC914C3|nr:TonB-dependent receptor [Comamonas thiooxydans]MCO8250821.1 TonB-dependent receptor [Comamonas thiooxydans]UBQ40730.1 TonB-dependent receptor [Comamonas thiooxydans]